MAYHETADLQNLFDVRTLNLSSTDPNAHPTPKTVSAWIAETEAQIDSALRPRYVTPITGADSLLIVKRICVGLTAAKIWDAVYGNAAASAQRTRGFDLRKNALDELEMYTGVPGKDPVAVLIDADKRVAEPAVLSPAAGFKDADGKATGKLFTRDQVF